MNNKNALNKAKHEDIRDACFAFWKPPLLSSKITSVSCSQNKKRKEDLGCSLVWPGKFPHVFHTHTACLLQDSTILILLYDCTEILPFRPISHKALVNDRAAVPDSIRAQSTNPASRYQIKYGSLCVHSVRSHAWC